MNDPQELKVLKELYEKIKKTELTSVEELSNDEVKLLKEIAKNWPSIEKLIKEHEAWQGFFRIGKYLFWFVIGALMLFTYYRDLILERIQA
jgi:hypothetical protein